MSIISNNTFTIKQLPQPVGYWQITPDIEDGQYSTRIAVYKKPEKKHIENTELWFGWKWIENDPTS